MGNRERKGYETDSVACSAIAMPIYWPYGNRTDAGLSPVWPFMAAPLSRQNSGYLPAVLLALLESSAKGRGSAEGKTTDAPQGPWAAPAHTGPRAASGC